MKKVKALHIPWNEPLAKFLLHFHYPCPVPRNARIDSEEDFKEFSDLIDKCIADNFDYTIEKYGNVPAHKYDPTDIIID